MLRSRCDDGEERPIGRPEGCGGDSDAFRDLPRRRRDQAAGSPRTAASRRRPACRRARRRRRPSRSAVRARRSRAPSTSTGRPRPSRCASSRSNTRPPSRTTKSVPSCCGRRSRRPRTGGWTSAGRRTRVVRRACSATFIECPQPCGSPRSLSSSAAALVALLAAAAPARRGQRRLRARAARVAERRGHHGELLVRLRVLPRDLPPRRGPPARVRAPLPAAKPAARRRRRPDPRLEPARARVDGRPGRDPVRDRGVRLRRSCRASRTSRPPPAGSENS